MRKLTNGGRFTTWVEKECVEERALGGALLHLAMADIGQNFDIDAPADGAVLDALFAAEDAAMARGEIGSDFVVITAIKAA